MRACSYYDPNDQSKNARFIDSRKTVVGTLSGKRQIVNVVPRRKIEIFSMHAFLGHAEPTAWYRCPRSGSSTVDLMRLTETRLYYCLACIFLSLLCFPSHPFSLPCSRVTYIYVLFARLSHPLALVRYIFSQLSSLYNTNYPLRFAQLFLQK